MPLPACRLIAVAGGGERTSGATGGAEVLALPVRPGLDGPGRTELADLGLDPDGIAALLRREKATGEPGQVCAVPLLAAGAGPHTLLLAAIGNAGPGALRQAGAAVARRARLARSLTSRLAVAVGDEELRAHVEGLLLASYSFTRKSEPKPPTLGEISVAVDDVGSRQGALDRAVATAAATALARDLVNTPALEADPAWLAAQARRVGRRSGLSVRVRGAAALRAEGFGGLAAVGQGSARPPQLVEITYRPDLPGGHVVLVGKGITFDSGGLSLKSNDGMQKMKTDMAGAGAVLAAMSALRDLGVRAQVTGLLACAENLPSGSATRPGDVISHYGGRTVEVLNTDAEGRLVLADALAYADDQLDPDVVVDLATLTGAMPVALGRQIAGLFTADDRLAGELADAAAASGDRLWRMPLIDDYRDALDSPVADLRNIADPKRGYSAGSIIAALFLREFAGGRRWAHLDIAGPARADADADEISKGGTGYGVRLLLHWLEGVR